MESPVIDPQTPLPEWLARLRELALNLRWTWDRETRALFREIYPELWDQTEDNPWLVLRVASPQRLEDLARDDDFHACLEQEYAELQRYMAEWAWFHQAHPEESEAQMPTSPPSAGLPNACPSMPAAWGFSPATI
jgi:starch phosphorylase